MDVRRLTDGPRHHFFGYYGIAAWDKRQRYHLALETDFQDHPPDRGDTAKVCVVRTDTGATRQVGETAAFNLQQGSMMHWIDAGSGEELTYNDWDDRRLVSRAVNPDTGARRTIDCAIAAVSPTEPVAIGLNYARMSFCRRVVGYANNNYSFDHYTPIPEDDGLWAIDLRTGKAKLVLSIAEAYRGAPMELETPYPVWFNHVVFNPEGTRILFFCRRWAYFPEFTRFETIWSADPDGGNPRLEVDKTYTSHYAWKPGGKVVMSTRVTGEMQFVQFQAGKRDYRPYGAGLLPADGHNAYSPDYRWMVTDTTRNENGRRVYDLMLYNEEQNRVIPIGTYAHPANLIHDCRCDLHPRWSPDGTMVSFDSAHEETRQIYIADVSEVVR